MEFKSTWNVDNKCLHAETVDFINKAILKMPTILLQNFVDELVINLHKCETDELLEQLMWTHNRCLAELKSRGI